MTKKVTKLKNLLSGIGKDYERGRQEFNEKNKVMNLAEKIYLARVEDESYKTQLSSSNESDETSTQTSSNDEESSQNESNSEEDETSSGEIKKKSEE